MPSGVRPRVCRDPTAARILAEHEEESRRRAQAVAQDDFNWSEIGHEEGETLQGPGDVHSPHASDMVPSPQSPAASAVEVVRLWKET